MFGLIVILVSGFGIPGSHNLNANFMYKVRTHFRIPSFVYGFVLSLNKFVSHSSRQNYYLLFSEKRVLDYLVSLVDSAPLFIWNLPKESRFLLGTNCILYYYATLMQIHIFAYTHNHTKYLLLFIDCFALQL